MNNLIKFLGACTWMLMAFYIFFSREIKREEFMKVIGLMHSYNRQGVSHSNGLRFGLKVGGFIENGGLLQSFFGKDGTGCLQHDTFVQFLRDLHDEVLHATH